MSAGNKGIMAFPFNGTKEQEAELRKLIDKYRGEQGILVTVLQGAQEIYGYLPIEVQTIISEELGASLAEIYGIITFYSQFSLTPKGKNVVSVCTGTACYVKGAQAILDEVKKVLGIEVGETTPDGKFTIQDTRCLGCCGLAPVMVINDDVYGRLVPADVKTILDKR